MYYRDHSRHNDVYSKVRRNILPFVCIGLGYFFREYGSTFGCVELEYFSRECGSTFGCISGDFLWAIIFHKLSAPPSSQVTVAAWLLQTNPTTQTAAIIISFIFENTSSATNQFEFVYREPRQRTGRMSSSEARIAKMKHDKRLRASKRNFMAKVMESAFSFEPSLAGTDVVGSIKLLSDVSKSNP